VKNHYNGEMQGTANATVGAMGAANVIIEETSWGKVLLLSWLAAAGNMGLLYLLEKNPRSAIVLTFVALAYLVVFRGQYI